MLGCVSVCLSAFRFLIHLVTVRQTDVHISHSAVNFATCHYIHIRTYIHIYKHNIYMCLHNRNNKGKLLKIASFKTYNCRYFLYNTKCLCVYKMAWMTYSLPVWLNDCACLSWRLNRWMPQLKRSLFCFSFFFFKVAHDTGHLFLPGAVKRFMMFMHFSFSTLRKLFTTYAYIYNFVYSCVLCACGCRVFVCLHPQRMEHFYKTAVALSWCNSVRVDPQTQVRKYTRLQGCNSHMPDMTTKVNSAQWCRQTDHRRIPFVYFEWFFSYCGIISTHNSLPIKCVCCTCMCVRVLLESLLPYVFDNFIAPIMNLCKNFQMPPNLMMHIRNVGVVIPTYMHGRVCTRSRSPVYVCMCLFMDFKW